MKAAPSPSAPADRSARASHAGSGPLFLVWTALILAVYVLSTGPAGKLAEKHVLSEGVFATLYAPLIWTYEHCPPAKAFFEWYLFDLWHWHLFGS